MNTIKGFIPITKAANGALSQLAAKIAGNGTAPEPTPEPEEGIPAFLKVANRPKTAPKLSGAPVRTEADVNREARKSLPVHKKVPTTPQGKAPAAPPAKAAEVPAKSKTNPAASQKPAAKAKNSQAQVETKTEAVARLLKRKNGCTTAEILAETQWPAVSVPQMAKANGLKLRKEKVKGQPTRYFGS